MIRYSEASWLNHWVRNVLDTLSRV